MRTSLNTSHKGLFRLIKQIIEINWIHLKVPTIERLITFVLQEVEPGTILQKSSK